jgi:hypothetical protein
MHLFQSFILQWMLRINKVFKTPLLIHYDFFFPCKAKSRAFKSSNEISDGFVSSASSSAGIAANDNEFKFEMKFEIVYKRLPDAIGAVAIGSDAIDADALSGRIGGTAA